MRFRIIMIFRLYNFNAHYIEPIQSFEECMKTDIETSTAFLFIVKESLKLLSRGAIEQVRGKIEKSVTPRFLSTDSAGFETISHE